MMDFFAGIFEKCLNALAVIGLIAGAIVGGIVGTSLDHVFLGVILGVLAVFVFEIFLYGFISQIIIIRKVLDEVSIDTDEQQRHFVIKELLEKQNNILHEMVNKA